MGNSIVFLTVCSVLLAVSAIMQCMSLITHNIHADVVARGDVRELPMTYQMKLM